MIMPVTLSVITTSFPRDQQAKAIGTWAGFAGAGGIIGLFVSAALIDNVTWPWVFALPVALDVVSFVATAVAVPRSVEQTEAGFDVVGSLLAVAAVGGALLAILQGPEQGCTRRVPAPTPAPAVLSSPAFMP